MAEKTKTATDVAKEIAIKNLETMKLYKPYTKEFKKSGTVTMYEYGIGYYVCDWQNEDVYAKQKEIEANGVTVYAIVHSMTNFGELYSFLIVPNEDPSYGEVSKEGNCFYAYSATWNKDGDFVDYGDIGVRELYGGLERVY